MDQLNSNTDIISRKRGKHLSLDERGAIQVLHSQGQSLRAIAAKIGCVHTLLLCMSYAVVPRSAAAIEAELRFTRQSVVRQLMRSIVSIAASLTSWMMQP